MPTPLPRSLMIPGPYPEGPPRTKLPMCSCSSYSSLPCSCPRQSCSTCSCSSHEQLPPPCLWTYRCEGSQKVVFSIPLNPPVVLALFLQTPPPPHPPNILINHLHSFLLSNRLVHLPPSTLPRLARRFDNHRPVNRRRRNSLSACPGSALLIPDAALCFGRSTILVELKPKGGVLCSSKLVRPDTAALLRKFKWPSVWLKRYVFVGGEVVALPKDRYDPVELMRDGGNVEAMMHRLSQEPWGGFRVWRGGQRVQLSDGIIERAGKAIKDSGVMKALRRVQEEDFIDHEGAGLIWERLKSLIGKEEARKRLEKACYEDEELREEIKERVSYASAEEGRRRHGWEEYHTAIAEIGRMTVSELIGLLTGYMAAAVGRDCSVMVAIEEDGEGWEVRVVDCGMKDVGKIEKKWVKVDTERVRRMIRAGGMPKEN